MYFRVTPSVDITMVVVCYVVFVFLLLLKFLLPAVSRIPGVGSVPLAVSCPSCSVVSFWQCRICTLCVCRNLRGSTSSISQDTPRKMSRHPLLIP